MPEHTTALSAEDVAALLAKPETKRSGGQRRKPDHEDRTIPGWFKVAHYFEEGTDCTCPKHDETPRVEHGPPIPGGDPIVRNRATTKIDDMYICRFCYVEQRDKIGN